jgi:predicted signal transduction protein with EAL and GGDEF domain
MNKLLYGLAALPFLASAAMAQPPVQLSDSQMDKVTAGWSLTEMDVSNTSVTLVAVYPAAVPAACATCFLDIRTPAISVQSIIKGGVLTMPGG